MDPNAALADLMDAYQRNDREAVRDALEALADWNNGGGFPPTVHTTGQERMGSQGYFGTYRIDTRD